MTLDTTTLADGHHEFRLVAVVADPIQTQGRAIWNATVDNGGHSIQLETDGPAKITLDESVTLDATMADAVRLELRHQGRVLEVVPCKVGFRSVELKNGNMLVNGVPIMIKGVNRHDHHPDLGKAARFHLNVLRTSCHRRASVRQSRVGAG